MKVRQEKYRVQVWSRTWHKFYYNQFDFICIGIKFGVFLLYILFFFIKSQVSTQTIRLLQHEQNYEVTTKSTESVRAEAAAAYEQHRIEKHLPAQTNRRQNQYNQYKHQEKQIQYYQSGSSLSHVFKQQLQNHSHMGITYASFLFPFFLFSLFGLSRVQKKLQPYISKS